MPMEKKCKVKILESSAVTQLQLNHTATLFIPWYVQNR